MANVSDWTQEDQAELMSKVAKKHNRLRWKNQKYRRKMLKVLRRAKRARTLGYRKKFLKFHSKMVKRGKELYESHKNDLSFWKKVHKSHTYPSRIQISIPCAKTSKCCRGIRLEYVVGRYSIDIAHPAKRVAMEVDNAYWHSLQKGKLRRDRFLKREGWRVVRVSDELSSAKKLSEVLHGER